MYEKAARTGNLLYRATTLGGTALTLILFLWKGPMGTFRLVLFLAWLALGAYSSVKTLADLASDRRARETNFQTMLKTWEGRTGSPSSALSSFWTITLVTAAGKLLVPILLYLV